MKLPAGAFTVHRKIRFGHADPAGIVFFPEYFRMFNELFEDWMADGLGIDFAGQFTARQHMFPLVHIDTDFKKPREIGQSLALTLVLTELGRSSFKYTIYGHDAGEEILRANCINCVASMETQRTVPVPEEFRTKMEDYLAKCRD